MNEQKYVTPSAVSALIEGKIPEELSLEVKELECVRGDRVLFSGLNFRIDSGQLLQVAGANGSGKTSLLRILSGLRAPSMGQVLWCGRPTNDDRSQFWSQMAYLGHDDGVKMELTMLENTRIARGLAATPADTSAEDALAKVGLQGYEDAPARVLSAGQRRRVALARLLVNDAKLWLLDEPLTALDESGQELGLQLLLGHIQYGGIVVVASHHALPDFYGKYQQLSL